MLNRPPCQCGFVSVSPEADSSAVCGGCGRPLGAMSDDGGANTHPFLIDRSAESIESAEPVDPAGPTTPAPAEHVVKLRRRTPPPPPDVPGYEILGELGRGGMGVVYKAREVSLNRIVALKMILTGVHASDTERARFRREAEAVAALRHPGIVQIFHVGEHAGQPYLVLEYIDGGNLAERIGGGDLLPVREAAAVVEQLARAMQFAHEQGVIHRDLKPANILLTRKEGSGSGSSVNGSKGGAASCEFKISDFGLAKKLDETVAAVGGTRTGAVMGTPSYISPEQAGGKANQVTPRSDVYSLGAILYEILTDRPPFKADTPLETVLQVIHDDPVPPGQLRPKLPKDLETICLKCLAKDPAKRYSTAAALADDLGRFLRGEPIHARPVSAVARGWKWVRRHPAITAFATTAAVAVLAVLTVLAVSNARLADANRQKAEEASVAREQEAIATIAKRDAETLAGERQRALDQLAAEAERNRRSVYALQLAQVANTVSRDPATAARLLDDPVKCPPDLREFTWRYLRRLCSRAETVYTAHRRPVLAVAVSPDGALIATGDAAGQILLWHPQTRIAYAVLVGPARAVNGLAFAPDGTAVAAACGDGSVRVWRLDPELLDAVRQSARLLPDAQAELNRLLPAAARSIAPAVAPTVTLRAFGREGRCVAFSSDGRLLAAGGADHERAAGQPDGAAKVWRMADLWPNPADAALSGFAGLAAEQITRNRNGIRALKEVKDHLQPVCSVAFSPDGRTLATGSEDRGVILSQLNSDKREELRLHGGPVSALAFTRDGTTLATADNGENPVIVVWDLGKKRATERRKLIGHTGAVCGLAFSGDGRTLATVAALPDPTVRVWDVDTGTEAARLYGHRGTVHAVGWLPDRRTLVTASDDTTVRVWGTTARTNDTAVPFGDESAKVLAAALTPAGTTLATIDARSDVRLWAVDKLFAGRDAELPVFLTSGKPADNREWRVNGLALSADGSAVAVAAADGVRVWDLSAGRRVFGAAVLTVSPKGFAPGLEVRAVQFTPDGSQLVGLTATGVRVWDATTGEDETPEAWKAIRPPEAGGAVAVGPDGKTVAVSALGPNHEPGLVLADADGVGFARTPAQVTTLDFSPDGEQLAVGVWRHPGRVLHLTRDAGGWEATALCETAEPFSALRFCREGKTLLGVRANRELVLVDAATGVERAVLSGHADRIVGAGFSPRDQALVTVGRDGAVKRWNADPNSRVMLWETRPPRTAPTPAAPPAVVR